MPSIARGARAIARQSLRESFNMDLQNVRQLMSLLTKISEDGQLLLSFSLHLLFYTAVVTLQKERAMDILHQVFLVTFNTICAVFSILVFYKLRMLWLS